MVPLTEIKALHESWPWTFTFSSWSPTVPVQLCSSTGLAPDSCLFKTKGTEGISSLLAQVCKCCYDCFKEYFVEINFIIYRCLPFHQTMVWICLKATPLQSLVSCLLEEFGFWSFDMFLCLEDARYCALLLYLISVCLDTFWRFIYQSGTLSLARTVADCFLILLHHIWVVQSLS